jgi:hypothetical protein
MKTIKHNREFIFSYQSPNNEHEIKQKKKIFEICWTNRKLMNFEKFVSKRSDINTMTYN